MIKILIGVAVLAGLGILFGLLQVLRFSGPEPEEDRRSRGSGEKDAPRLAAVVHCTGCGSEFTKYRYQGIRDCLAAAGMPGGGPLRCDKGCLGMGSCALVCPAGAIRMEGGAARVDRERCIGCGACVEVCPRDVIALEPFRPKRHVFIPCASRGQGKAVTEFCSDGCIGCGLCAKECPREAITVEEGLARIDYDKCDACGLCIQKCPRHLIQVEEVPEPPKEEPKLEKAPKPPKKHREPKHKVDFQLPIGKKTAGEKKEEPPEETPEEEAAEVEDLPVKEEPEQDGPVPEKEPEETVIPAETTEDVGTVEETVAEEISVPTSAAGEEKREGRMSAEAFKAFEQVVAAAGEILGEKEELSGEEPPDGEEVPASSLDGEEKSR